MKGKVHCYPITEALRTSSIVVSSNDALICFAFCLRTTSIFFMCVKKVVL